MGLVKKKEGQPNVLGRKSDSPFGRLILSKMFRISMERGRNGWLSLLSLPQEWLDCGNQEVSGDWKSANVMLILEKGEGDQLHLKLCDY